MCLPVKGCVPFGPVRRAIWAWLGSGRQLFSVTPLGTPKGSALTEEHFCSDSGRVIRYGIARDGFWWGYWRQNHIAALPIRFAKDKEIVVMGKVIEFYEPINFRTPLKVASRQYGKVIESCPQIKKSA